ncbi:RRQRL motif-containing zinc-binding protein [Rhodococcus erythropolis]
MSHGRSRTPPRPQGCPPGPTTEHVRLYTPEHFSRYADTGGQEPVAILRCKACATRPNRACTRAAYLYRVDLALPMRPMTLAKEAALDRAMAARTTCPKCRRRYHHVLPLRTLGSCLLRTTEHVPMPCPTSLRR